MSIEFIVKDSEFSYGLKNEHYQTIYLCCMKPECESGDTCKHKREQYHVILTPKILARYNDIEYEHSWFVYDISEQKLLETKNGNNHGGMCQTFKYNDCIITLEYLLKL